jgi:hypothetical protein
VKTKTWQYKKTFVGERLRAKSELVKPREIDDFGEEPSDPKEPKTKKTKRQNGGDQRNRVSCR